MGHFFYKKSFNMMAPFTKKSVIIGLIFWQPKFSGFRKSQNLWKNGPVFQEKSLTMCTLFCQNDP